MTACSEQVHAFHTLHEAEADRRNRFEEKTKSDHNVMWERMEHMELMMGKLQASGKTLKQEVEGTQTIALASSTSCSWATGEIEKLQRHATAKISGRACTQGDE